MLLTAVSVMGGMTAGAYAAQPVHDGFPSPPADKQSPSGTALSGVQFDIPAQPMEAALEAYGEASGISVLYNSRLTDGRMSQPVRGRYSVEVALAMLVAGSGLNVRRTAPGAFTLAPDPAAAIADGGKVDGVQGPYQRYYGLVQDQVRETFCHNRFLSQGRYRMVLRFWFASTGTIERARLVDSTGDAAVDAEVVASLEGASLGEVPPADMPQPLTMLVLPRSSGLPWGCPAAAVSAAP